MIMAETGIMRYKPRIPADQDYFRQGVLNERLINQMYIKFFMRKITHRRMKKFNVKAKRFLL